MGLETATYISGLDSDWPLGTDQISTVDDHIRLIKSVIKSTFPGEGGTGFSQAITLTEDEINSLVADVATNTEAIAQNTLDINANADAIAANAADIATILAAL